MSAALLLTPWHLAAMRLMDAADLVADPVTGGGWAIVDPTLPAEDDGVLATGDTLAAAIDAALPVALAESYVTSEAVEALDGPAEPGVCWRCDGSGEGASERHACPVCRGSGSERGAQ